MTTLVLDGLTIKYTGSGVDHADHKGVIYQKEATFYDYVNHITIKNCKIEGLDGA